jgi:acetyltransferase-like isoleucine patch superfamily enzyme
LRHRSAAAHRLLLQANLDASPGVSRIHPATRTLLALWRGWRCRLIAQARGLRFEAGPGLRIDGRLWLRGPGRVIFGARVRIGDVVTPWTYDADAVISVGDYSFLNGTRFGCAREIRVGARAILADARLLDTDFHSLAIDRHRDDAPVRVAPVILEDNVWVAAGAGILPGTRIGKNSVVGFGAVCIGEYPANVLIAGNPARVVRGLD